jgi:histidinol-phosphate/aromatic aminotransferase/cobyric acid decarboxylase-like protein
MDAPYWPSYPTLARHTRQEFTTIDNVPGSWHPQSVTRVITSPNNPDGAESVGECEIWDAAYFHWVYGAKAVPVHAVSVWSAAKLFGVSGLRIGCVTTDDADLAEKMRQYIETTTSGVSNEAQTRLAGILEIVKAETVLYRTSTLSRVESCSRTSSCSTNY